jgi:tight adherence protein B
MSGLAYGLLAALGVHLLWSRPGERRQRRVRLAGLGLPVLAGLGGAAVGLVAIGGLASLAIGVLAGTCAVLGRRSVGAARREQARRLWPSMLEEIRVLTTSGGRSIPRALFEVGIRAPAPTGDAFRSAQQAWRVSADLDRTLAVLRDQLADASTDVVTETLLVAHQLGGADVGRRLARLAEDRRRDLAARDLAVAKLAGARFARRFVVIVPLGMAVAGQAVGTGRQAFASPAGQAVGLVAAAMVAACWLWAGTLLKLPDEPRVFAG